MDEEFDNLVQEYLDWWVETNPIMGTVLGLHQYDHLLPDGSRDAHLRDIEKIKEFRTRTEAIDESKLSPQKRTEREAVLHMMNMGLYMSEVYRQWESKPMGIDILGASLFRLYAREFAPLEERLESITSRIQAMPRFLEESKTMITKPVKLWVEIELESSKRFPMFLEDIMNTGTRVLDAEKLETLKKAVEDAKAAITDYEKWMSESLLPTAIEEHRMGEEMFHKVIELKHLGLSVAEIRELGDKYLDWCKKRLEELAEEIKPGAGVEEVREIVKSDHPENFDQVLEKYRESVAESRRFVQENGMIDIPAGEKLTVIETPEYLRNTIPFAAYMMPGKYDQEQEGIYIVTPVEDKPELLKEHSYAGIVNTSVHEGYPGHHLQLTVSNMNPSLAMVLVHSTETVEGWAHYCEDWMKDKGFDDTPEARFVQTIDILWRAARIIVDVDLHTKKMTMEQAIDFLVDNVGMERPSAVAEVKRYTMYPTYQLCYLIGKHLIVGLKKEIKERMGDKFTDTFFHNTFLGSGSLPVYLTRQTFLYKLQEMGL
ncbi:MAG: DUF885 domain-containing protein [Thermoplasmata archaeon]|nr:DUF885 domain-containing protein [Thermoplasmata archaeon]